MADVPEYTLAEAGVSLTQSPVHTPEGGVLSAQNVEKIRVQGLGGLGSRGGLAAISSMTALGAAVVALANLPFTIAQNAIMMIALNTAELVNSWKTTVDGVTFLNLTPSVLQRSTNAFVFGGSFSGSFMVPGNIFIGQRAANFKNKFYFSGADYTTGTSQPVVVMYDGRGTFEILRIPNNPTGGGGPAWGITDMWVDNGVIYIAVFDPGGAAPSTKGRVIAFDPSAGSIFVVGNYFGNGAGENVNGMPYAMCSWLGRLFVGTMGLSGAPDAAIYSILPGVESTWTLEHQFASDQGWAMSLCTFNGNLYVAVSADVSGNGGVWQRTPGGTWTHVFTGPDTAVGYCCGLVVFNNTLFCVYFSETHHVLIKSSTDGSTWTTDLDVGADLGNTTHAPGTPFVFDNQLFFPFFSATADDLTGVLYARTTLGVYTKPLNGFGIRGCLGQYLPGG